VARRPNAELELEVRIGLATETGLRQRNEDYAGAYLGTAEERANHGVVAVVADGVGGARGGRQAAETAVRGFIDGYLSGPGGPGVEDAADRVLTAVNSWIHTQGRLDPELAGMATTFSAVILRDGRAHLVHVGDSRIYHLAGGELRRLTEDHNLHEIGLSHILLRCLGTEETVDYDYAAHEIAAQDRFLLVTDGVHGVLADGRIADLVASQPDPDEAARRLTKAALEAGSYDNVTALVVDVLSLPATA
jgi:serine/threonine protein phosphatase PrpC